MSYLNTNFAFAVLTASIGGGFHHGYHTGVINVPQEILIAWLDETMNARSDVHVQNNTLTLLWGVSTSTLNVGGTIGGLLSGLFAASFGSKTSLFLISGVAFVAMCLMGGAKWLRALEVFIVGRFLIGVACGLFSGLAPMYLAEISPGRMRGRVGTMYQLVITISIMFAQLLGMDFLLGTKAYWNYLFLMPVPIVLFQVICLPFCVESPKYLLSRNRQEKSLAALKWLRKQDDVSKEMSLIKAENDALRQMEKVRLMDMFQTPYLRKPLMISLFIMAAQQLSGINAIIFYSTGTFESIGLSRVWAQYATFGIGIINVIATVAAFFLVDTLGRKWLLLVGFAGMALDTLLLSLCLYFGKGNHVLSILTVVFVFLYIILYAIGVGPIPWFIVSELFNQSARSKAISMAAPTNWIINFLVTLSFPSIEAEIGSLIFLIFVALNIIFFFVVLHYVPETNNKTIDETTNFFK